VVSTAGERWLVLDVGETLIDETRIWSAWADEMGIRRMTLMAAFGAIVARGEQYQDIAKYFPVDDWRLHLAAVEAKVGGFQPADLYGDVLPSLALLRERFRVAIIGNQPAERTAQLRAIGVDAEVMAMSDEMGVAKPDPRFFSDALRRIGDPDPGAVAYVGDRIDNDVLPSHAAGMRAVWLRRGPWGTIPTEAPDEAALVVSSLTELVARIDEAWPN
jgi:HAD superfamily hydrolase (TIGR01549 family)